MTTPDSDRDLLVAAAEEAGALALRFFGSAQRTWEKEGGSIVGEADIAVDRRLAEILRGARPDYGWLSEETADDPARLSRERIFVVDPIDGTRAFVAGRKEWTISLAVVERGRPLTAVLAAPSLHRRFTAVEGQGAFADGVRLAATSATSFAGARFASSRRYARKAGETASAPLADVRYVPSLAYRLALVATGEIDVAIAGANARDWDLAAADLLVQEAGARLAGLDGGAPRYNRADTSHPMLVAAGPALFDRAVGLVKAADAEASSGNVRQDRL